MLTTRLPEFFQTTEKAENKLYSGRLTMQREGQIRIPVSMQKNRYEIVTLNGKLDASFDGDTIHLPAFEGMLALIAVK